MRKQENFPLRMLVLITQIGITMMVPIFFCAWLGSIVAEKTGAEIVFVFFLFIGILAGFRSCYTIIRRFVSLKSTSLESTLVRPHESHITRAERDRRLRSSGNSGTQGGILADSSDGASRESTEVLSDDSDDSLGERPEDPWDR